MGRGGRSFCLGGGGRGYGLDTENSLQKYALYTHSLLLHEDNFAGGGYRGVIRRKNGEEEKEGRRDEEMDQLCRG